MLAVEAALDVDDLEADNRHKDLILSYVSGEKGKDRFECKLRFLLRVCLYLFLFQHSVLLFESDFLTKVRKGKR